jgi:hypothetical protein
MEQKNRYVLRFCKGTKTLTVFRDAAGPKENGRQEGRIVALTDSGSHRVSCNFWGKPKGSEGLTVDRNCQNPVAWRSFRYRNVVAPAIAGIFGANARFSCNCGQSLRDQKFAHDQINSGETKADRPGGG